MACRPIYSERKISMKKSLALLCAAALFFAFAACGEKNSGESNLKIGGYDAVRLDDNVFYVEAVTLESDPGENPSALDSAKTAWAVLKKMDLQAENGGSIYISLTGMEDAGGEDRYAFKVGMGSEYETGGGYVNVYSLWVNYAGDVFTFTGGEPLIYSEVSNGWEPAGEGHGDLIPLDEEQAMCIAGERLSVQLQEGLVLVAKGEDAVNGQHAFLFDLGRDTEEKFTAEEHYAVTDDGEVWLLDILADEWMPAAAG